MAKPGQSKNLRRLERVVAELPEAQRVDVEAWGDHPTFRVRGKNFIFCDPKAHNLTVKLPLDEAAAVLATDPSTQAAGYGLGRHGWIDIEVGPHPDENRWQEITEWIRMSYTLVAPKRLAKLVLDEETRS